MTTENMNIVQEMMKDFSALNFTPRPVANNEYVDFLVHSTDLVESDTATTLAVKVYPGSCTSEDLRNFAQVVESKKVATKGIIIQIFPSDFEKNIGSVAAISAVAYMLNSKTVESHIGMRVLPDGTFKYFSLTNSMSNSAPRRKTSRARVAERNNKQLKVTRRNTGSVVNFGDVTGEVSVFFPKKGFGFISTSTSGCEKVYFHVKQVKDPDLKESLENCGGNVDNLPVVAFKAENAGRDYPSAFEICPAG